MVLFPRSFFRRWLVLGVLAGGACTLGAREIQEGVSFVGEDVIANGGGLGTSPRFAVQDVIGQPIQLGTTTTGEFTEAVGFIEALSGSLSDPRDINADGAVNAGDRFMFSSGWHRLRDEPGYRDRADIDGNTIIDRNDLDRYLEMLKEIP